MSGAYLGVALGAQARPPEVHYRGTEKEGKGKKKGKDKGPAAQPETPGKKTSGAPN